MKPANENIMWIFFLHFQANFYFAALVWFLFNLLFKFNFKFNLCAETFFFFWTVYGSLALLSCNGLRAPIGEIIHKKYFTGFVLFWQNYVHWGIWINHWWLPPLAIDTLVISFSFFLSVCNCHMVHDHFMHAQSMWLNGSEDCKSRVKLVWSV